MAKKEQRHIRATVMPMVSVVIPAFNAGRWLAESVTSIRSQTLEDWECLIVNDASTDDTAAVASSFADARVHVITHDVNRGAASARNTGIEAASGSYIQILDADDVIQDDKLRFQSEFLNTHPSVGIVYGDGRYFDDGYLAALRRGPSRDEETMYKLSGGRDVFLPALLDRNGLPMPASLIRRDVFSEVGLHDEGLRSHEDFDWLLRAAIANVQIAYVPSSNSMVLMRRRDGNLTSNQSTMAANRLEVRRRMDRILTGDVADTNRTRYVEALEIAAWLCMQEKRIISASAFLLRALRLARNWRQRVRMVKRAAVTTWRLWARYARPAAKPK